MGELKDKLAGKFIVIDGPDGAGKSTQVDLLAKHLVSQGADVQTCIDPGSTSIGTAIRGILLDRDNGGMGRMSETLLFMASRAQLVWEVIRPALEEDKVVLCDRFVSATVAYQGAAGVDRKLILELGNIAIEGLWPDLSIVLDVPADLGMKRIGVARKRLKSDREAKEQQLPLFGDRLEIKTSEYHREVRRIFRTLDRDYPSKVRYVRATQEISDVFEEVVKTISEEFLA